MLKSDLVNVLVAKRGVTQKQAEAIRDERADLWAELVNFAAAS